jgi:hypothetical protein
LPCDRRMKLGLVCVRIGSCATGVGNKRTELQRIACGCLQHSITCERSIGGMRG